MHPTYAVQWATVTPEESYIISRHRTLDAAMRVARKKNKELHAVHFGQLLCGFRVLEWDYEDQVWRPYYED